MDSPSPQDQNSTPQPQLSVNSVGRVSKEAELPLVKNDQVEFTPEHEKIPEVPFPLTVVPTRVDVPPDLLKIGVAHAPQDQPVIQTTQGAVPSLPLTDDQIGEGLTKKASSSFRWLAEWCLKQLRKLHVTLQKVQGHFIRITEK